MPSIQNRAKWRRLSLALLFCGVLAAVIGITVFRLNRQTPEQQRETAIRLQTIDLPPIERVEILAIGEGQKTKGTNDFVIKPAIEYAGYAPILKSKTIKGTDAEELARLWRTRVFGGGGALCHEPPYALRFYRGGKLIFETSLCWECFNFVISFGPDKAGWMGFEDPNEELLNRLKQQQPIPSEH